MLPPMGYNTWNDMRCDGVSATRVYAIADAMVSLGLVSRGFTYLVIDDCWQAPWLDPQGRLVPDHHAFPDGLRVVADYLRQRGLRLGLYSARGSRTCAGRPASGGHEALHARQFAHEWHVDYLKYDSCWASNDHDAAFAQYATMRNALNATGRRVFFSLCGWNAWYAPRGASLGDSWRIAADADTFANVYVAIRTNEGLARYAGPQKGWNDPDMLLGSSGKAAVSLTSVEVQTQFSMWAIMAAPLLIGAPMNDGLPAADLETFLNAEVIDVNQDPLGIQGVPVFSNCPPFVPRDNWWMSPWSMPQDVANAWVTALLVAATLFLAGVIGCAALQQRRRRGRGGSETSADSGEEAASLVGGAPQLRRCCSVSGSAHALASLLANVCLVAGLLAALTLVATIRAYRPRIDPCQQIWARPLHDGTHAVCFVNFAPTPIKLHCDASCVAAVLRGGAPADVHARATTSTPAVRLRDLQRRRDVPGRFRTINTSVEPHGSVLYRLTVVRAVSDEQAS